MAEGFSLNVDAKFLQDLEKADKLVNQIADSSQKMSKTVIESFKDANNNALKPFIENLNSVRQALDKKAKPIIFKEINTQASQAADRINSFISLMDKINNTGSNKTRNSAVTKINQELEDAKKRLVELQNLLNFYAKGEGRKAIGFVDTTNIQQEARALMNRIDLLEREKASIQANARLRMEVAKRQEALDNNWVKMEVDRNRRINQSAKNINAAYNKMMSDRMKAMSDYEKLFDKIEGKENRRRSNQSIANKGTILYDSIYSPSGIKSIHNMRNAIAQMQEAQNQLNLKTSDGKKRYDELSSKIKQVQKDIDAATNSNKKFGESHSKLLNYAQQLRRSLALIFSISQISGYINKLVSVRKEFELQQKSLQVLLQSKDEANKLWQQTVDLAVRSPFRVKELVTYTRQLAAYRIETNKLHDTTKRLADVSAGLGVDMQRLILAFGQVRAANFLRGTELRQFTEAGIPMLDELAKHFTELEGKAISAGEVFEMISKRMVLFEDVEAVFKKMTSEGGAFFQMQEEQSKTLAGMISNLYDTIDLMLNDIGKSYDSFLKNSVNFAKFFVENWRAMAEAIKSVLLALAGYKLYQLAVRQSIIDTAVAQGILNNSNTKQLTQIQLLRVGWNNLTISMKAAGTFMKSMLAFNLPLLAATALVSGVWKLVSAWKEHEEQLNKISKEYDELRKKAEKINVNFKIATDENNFKEQKNKLNELITLANNDYNMKIKVDVDGMDAKAIQDKFNEISSNIFEANIFAEHFAKQMQRATEWVVEDDIFEDLGQLGNKANDVLHELSLNRERIVFDLQKSQDKLNESQREALEMLKQPKQIDESEVDYLERLSKGYSLVIDEYSALQDALKNTKDASTASKLNVEFSKIQDTFKRLNIDAGSLYKLFNNYDKTIEEARVEFENFAKTLDLNKNLTDEQKELRLKTAIDKEAFEKGWNDFVKNYVYRWTEETFKIKFKPEIVEEDTLKAWQDTYNQLFRGMEGFREITKNTTTQKEIIDRLNASIKETEDLINRINKAGGIKATSKGGAYEGIDLSQLNNALLELKKQRDWLGGSDKNKDTGKDWMSEVVKGIKEAHQEYIKLNKTLSSAESKQMALAKYADLFKEAAQHTRFKNMNLKDIDFTTEKGTIKALEDMLNKLPKSAKQARITIQKALKEIRGEQTISFKIKEDQKILDQIEEMFSGYEMSIELEKLNIPPDLAKQLFNVDTLTLPELRQQVISELSKGAEEGSIIVQQELNKSIADVDWDLITAWLGEDQMKKAKDTLTKVNEMEEKAQEERLKKYAKYLVKAQSERIKAKVEEMRQIQEIEDTFKMTEGVATERFGMDSTQWKQYQNLKEINKEELKRIGLTNKQIEQILEYNEQMRVSAQLAKEGVKKETQEKVDKAVWEEFKGSAMYEQLFGDLENLGTKSIDVLMDRLEKMKEALKQLPPEVYKEIQTQLDKLGELKMERNPFSEFKKAFEDIEELQKKRITYTNDDGKKITLKGEDAIVYEMQLEQEKAEKIREQLTLYQQIYEANGDINKLTEVGVSLNDEQKELLGDNKAINDKILKLQEDLAKAEDEAKEKGQDAKKYKTARESLTKVQEATTEWGEAISGVLGGMDEILDAFGVAEDDSSRLWIQGAQQIANMIVQVVLLSAALKAMGVAANSALGVIGWIATGLSAVATIFASIFAAGDKKKEREIKRQIEHVETLEKSYKRLEKAIDDAYSINKLQTDNKAAQRNLENQIAAYDRMIQAEEAKKKTDKDRIKEWKNTQDELREQMQELREEVVSTATDGILDNVLDAAQAFTDAWYEAFKETGDGLSGLEENFTEVMQNLVKRQASMLITQQWVNKWKSELNKYLNPDDLTLTAQEAGLWVSEVKKSLPQLSDALDNYFKAMQQAGVDLMSGSLSGLAKGISGITESQADILAAYANSCRFFLANIDTTLTSVANQILGGENMPNPILSELKTQTELVRGISTLLNSVVRGSHSMGGQGIKVFIS